MVSMRGYLSQFCLGYVVVSVFAQCWPGPDSDGSVQVYSVYSCTEHSTEWSAALSTAAIADWDARRSGTVRPKQFTKQQV